MLLLARVISWVVVVVVVLLLELELELALPLKLEPTTELLLLAVLVLEPALLLSVLVADCWETEADDVDSTTSLATVAAEVVEVVVKDTKVELEI
ncbi:hypothetical protein HDV03_001790 [Kappamyces sp. JEL0829]|nr:hypothetical protein HDV03_001790 [Kappamyces sp. JEL0829]